MIAVGIVAHDSRADQARALADTVGADVLSVDDGSLGCDDNHDLVLSRLSSTKADWVVILEDDAAPIPDFRGQVTCALTAAPTPIVSLYLGRQRPPWAQDAVQAGITEADTLGASWLVSSHLLHAVAYAIRTPLVDGVLNFLSGFPVDQHVTAYAQAHGHLISYAWPSLVDHLDQPTLVDHPDNQPRTPGRVAYRVGARTEWSTRTASIRL